MARPPALSPALRAPGAPLPPVAPGVVPAGAFLPPLLPAMKGVEPPPGYVEKAKWNVPLLAGGGIFLAVTWGVSIGYGSSQDFENGLGALAVPVLGPWMALGKRDFTCNVETASSIEGIEESQADAQSCIANQTSSAGFLVGLGVGQLMATALLTVGILDRRRTWVRWDLAGVEVELDAAAVGRTTGVVARGSF